jgi:CRISPR/Cas system-associated endoribonuclease Cas2
MRKLYLIAYDICEPGRLNRAGQVLKAVLTELIDPAEDDIRVYPLPSGGAVVALGCGDRVPEGVSFYLN